MSENEKEKTRGRKVPAAQMSSVVHAKSEPSMEKGLPSMDTSLARAEIQTKENITALKMSSIEIKFFVYPRKTCTNETYLLILIHSATDHLYYRKRIRESWGNSKLLTDVKITTLFILGTRYQSRAGTMKKVCILHQQIISFTFNELYLDETSISAEVSLHKCTNLHYYLLPWLL